ncbi:MAG: hypothetical protein ACD_72C00300G0002 [uncultured bacterium]|nr:MAG: hypothetical protein ACD_72C00300G0002 [uncultured bacterium]
MIAATHSFKTTTVTPLTLQLASELINHGADRERIIQNLYRTRSLSTLKLWGIALSKLKIDAAKHFAWSSITKEDFSVSGSSKNDLKDIVSELISNSPEIDLTMLLFENESADGKKGVEIVLHSKKGHNTQMLLKKYNSTGTKNESTAIITETNIVDAEKNIVEEIKKSLS